MLYRCKEAIPLENTWSGQYLGGGGTIKPNDKFVLIKTPTPKKKLYQLQSVGKYPYTTIFRGVFRMNHNKEELLKDMLKRRAIDELGIDPLAPNSIELLNVEIENSVKRKKRLMRLEKEMLVDMVFNLESRNEMLVNNLSEVERMYNKLKGEKE